MHRDFSFSPLHEHGFRAKITTKKKSHFSHLFIEYPVYAMNKILGFGNRTVTKTQPWASSGSPSSGEDESL